LTQAIEAVQRSLETMQSEQLETSLKQLTELKQTNQVQLASQLMIVERLPAVIAQLVKDDAEIQQQQATAEEGLMAVEPQLVELTVVIEETAAQVATAQAQVDQYQPTLEQAQGDHRRLQDAMEFAVHETQLLSDMDLQMQLLETVADDWTRENESKNRVAAALTEQSTLIASQVQEIERWQLDLAQHEEQKTELAAKVMATQQELERSAARQKLWAETQEKLVASDALLAAAGQISGDDPAVQQVRQQLQTLIRAKAADLAAEVAQVEAWQNQVAEWTGQIQDHAATMAGLAAQVTLATAALQTQQAALKPQQIEHETLTAKVLESETRLAREQATWQDLRNQLLRLRGVAIAQENADEQPPSGAGDSAAPSGS